MQKKPTKPAPLTLAEQKAFFHGTLSRKNQPEFRGFTFESK